MGRLLLILQASAFIGFLMTAYLLRQKSQNKKVVCLFKDQCNDVLYSKYSKIFGVPTLAIGVAYYALAFLSVAYVQSYPMTLQEIPGNLFIVIAAMAVIFSFYQAAIQIFVLKKWCSWCLGSTILSTIILVAGWMLMY